MRLNKISFVLIASSSLFFGPSAYGSCLQLYQTATRDITEDERDAISTSDIRKEYCSQSKTTRATNLSSSAEAIIKAVPVKGGLNFGSSKEKVDYICDRFSSNSIDTSSTRRYTNTTTVDALKYYNQCVALEKSTATLTFEFAPPTSVVINAQLHDALKLRIYSVTFAGSKKSSCVINTKKDNANRQLLARTSLEVEGGFSIRCDREPDGRDKQGNELYQASTVILSTNLPNAGLFSIPFPPQKRDSANFQSEADRKLSELNDRITLLDAEKSKLVSDVSVLTGRLNNASVRSFVLLSGHGLPGQIVPVVRNLREPGLQPQAGCGNNYNWGAHVGPAAQQLCGADQANVTNFYLHSGGPCGHAGFIVSCLKK